MWMIKRAYSKELLWVVIGYLGNLLGLMAALKFLTTFLYPVEFGQYALGLAITGIIQAFIYGPISQATLRFFAETQIQNNLDGFFEYLQGLHLKIAFIIIVAGVLCSINAKYFFGLSWAILILAASVNTVAGGISNSIVAVFTATRDRVVVAVYQGVSVIFSTLFSIAAIQMYSTTGFIALCGYAIGLSLATLMFYLYAIKKFKLPSYGNIKNISKSTGFSRKYWRFASPFIVFALFGSVVNYGDRWLVQAIFDQEMVGIYTAILLIANTPMNIFGTIVSQFVLPVLYAASSNQQSTNRQDNIYSYVMLISAVCLLMTVLVAYIFSELILSIFTGPAFVPYHNSLWVIAFGCAMFQFGQLNVMKGLIEKRPHSYIVPKAIHAVSFLVVIALIGRKFSLMGVAIAICVSSGLYIVSVILANRQRGLFSERDH